MGYTDTFNENGQDCLSGAGFDGGYLTYQIGQLSEIEDDAINALTQEEWKHFLELHDTTKFRNDKVAVDFEANSLLQKLSDSSENRPNRETAERYVKVRDMQIVLEAIQEDIKFAKKMLVGFGEPKNDEFPFEG